MPTTDNVTLKEYFDRIMAEKDKALYAALSSAKEAVALAEANAAVWRANANEWRQTFADRDSLFMSKAEFTAYKNSVDKVLNEFASFREARSGVPADIDGLVKDMKTLNTFKDSMEGKASQKSVSTMTVISIVSLILAIVGVIMRLLGM
jgi:hypothetical protein